MSIDPDRELVKRCQTLGSQEFEVAFGLLYDSYKDRVYSLAYRITGNATEALDAAQEAFILLYQKIESFNYESKFSSWLYRLVINASIDHLRRVKPGRSELHSPPSASPVTSRHHSPHHSPKASSSTSEQESWDPLLSQEDPTKGPAHSAEVQDQKDAIQTGIDQLSDKLKVITVLRYQQNLSYEELGEILEVSSGTVKSRLARAHLALAKHLEHLKPDVSAAESDAAQSDAAQSDAAQSDAAQSDAAGMQGGNDVS